MCRVALLVVILAGCGGSASTPAVPSPTSGSASPSAPPRSPPGTPVLPTAPVSRSDRAGPTAERELARAELAFSALAATPLGIASAPGPDDAITVIVAQIRTASALAREVVVATAVAEAAPRVQVAALTLRADAYDLLAARIEDAPVPLPSSVRPTPASSAAFAARIRAALGPQLRSIHCLAVESYERVLEIDPANARATSQLAAYGEDFVASCAP